MDLHRHFGGFIVVQKNTFLHCFDYSQEIFHLPRSKSTPAIPNPLTEYFGLATPPAFNSILATNSRSGELTEVAQEVDMGDIQTLMIRGIPCSCTKDEILDAISELGFEGRHDYFYVPLRKKKTLGYAFVGFPNPQDAQEFVEAITGFSFKNRQSSKVVTVTPATVQGARNSLEDSKNTRSMKHKGQPTASSRYKNHHSSKVVTAMPGGLKDARNNVGHFKNTYLMRNSM